MKQEITNREELTRDYEKAARMLKRFKYDNPRVTIEEVIWLAKSLQSYITELDMLYTEIVKLADKQLNSKQLKIDNKEEEN